MVDSPALTSSAASLATKPCGRTPPASVPIYLGTDAGGVLPHGLVAKEAAEMVRAGLSTVDVLTASSWGARSWLRKPGLLEGASADLVVYQADPRADIGVLAAPEHIVLRGVVVS